jgi:glutathione S-transferase
VKRAECLSWLFWQMGSAPFLGGGFGHFYAYAPSKIEYAIDRYTDREFNQTSAATPDGLKHPRFTSLSAARKRYRPSLTR